MGQGSSQPERAAADAPRQAGRASAALRRVIPERRRHEQEYEQDGLLRDEQHTQNPRPTRRARTGSINRLSQLIGWADADNSPEMVQQDQSEQQQRGPLLDRTRSRFHEMLRRDGSHSFSLRSSARSQRRALHRRRDADADDEDTRAEDTPRLPSIDVSSTFEDTFAPPPPAANSSDAERPRTASPHRRSHIRFNARRPDPMFHPFRNFTSSLRRRRSPQPSISSIRQRGNEDQAAMLSRLLSVAAAATAATLMGDDPHAMSEARSLTGGTGLGDLAGGGEDGSFDGFLRALQNGRIASALRQGTNEDEADRDGSPAPPLNFFRMFRFGPANAERQPPVSLPTQENGEQQGRLVPIIIVGIRSISQGANSNAGSFNEDLPPFIDALGNFPSPLPTHALGAHGHDSIDAILRPPQNGTSFRHRRRASMGGFGMSRSRLSDRMDDQRDHRSPDRRRERPWSVASSSGFEPRPPSATPASPSPELSRLSSLTSTPNPSRPASLVARDSTGSSSEFARNNSLLNHHRSSAASPLSAHTEETASLHSTHSGTNLLSDIEPFRIHHRRSDTAPNVHYPRFASGHPRRNGVVEPDHLPSLSRTSSRSRNGAEASGARGGSREGNSNGNNSGSGGDARSWIIYVLGGSYPENHPILTTPSLFTENPTYEDMMLLSALLGPAKAPVATDEDVQSAGGLYEIVPVGEVEIAVGEVQMSDAAKTAELVAVATTPSPISPATSAEVGAAVTTNPISAPHPTPATSPDEIPTQSIPILSTPSTQSQLREKIPLEPGQRCLVCLCDFEVRDTARKLAKCGHLFHRECIDQWLTTGRNSCPLCREQGVDEKNKGAEGEGVEGAEGGVGNRRSSEGEEEERRESEVSGVEEWTDAAGGQRSRQEVDAAAAAAAAVGGT